MKGSYYIAEASLELTKEPRFVSNLRTPCSALLAGVKRGSPPCLTSQLFLTCCLCTPNVEHNVSQRGGGALHSETSQVCRYRPVNEAGRLQVQAG